MLARRKSKPSGIRDGGPIRNASHLKWVRGHVCAVPGCDTGKRIEAAHVRIGGDGGMGMKPGDDKAIPLCADHHAQQHRVGERSFAEWHRIDMQKLAAELWANSPHRIKSER